MKILRALLLGFVLVATPLACGGDDGDGGDSASAPEESTTDDSAAEESTTTTVSEKDEKAAVEAVVADYFEVLGKGDVDAAVGLLQDGETWRDEMEACSSLTKGVTADVKTVELTDASNAEASIAIVGPDGTVLLPEAGAEAIKVDGEWQVASSTFESLYDLAKDSCTG